MDCDGIGRLIPSAKDYMNRLAGKQNVILCYIGVTEI